MWDRITASGCVGLGALALCLITGSAQSAQQPVMAQLSSAARVEHFVLWLDQGEIGAAGGFKGQGGGASGRLKLGRALVRRVASDGRSSHELEVSFLADGARAHFVDRNGPGGHFLIARELLSRGGRSVTIQASGADSWRRTSWGRHGARRVDEPKQALDVGFPGLIELARAGTQAGASLRVFDLFADSWQPVELFELQTTGRRVEARTLAGDLMGWFEFDGAELIAFGWQAGGVIFERVPPEAWEDLAPIEAAHEADGSGR